MTRLLACVTAVLVMAVAMRTVAQPSKTDGQQIFRYDTFGDEQLWTATLKMPQALATVSPKTALSVGLKVDVEALPQSL